MLVYVDNNGRILILGESMGLLQITRIISCCLAILFFLFYAYQIIYMIVGLCIKNKPLCQAKSNHKFGLLVCARNEENQIANLIESLRAQDYPSDKFDIFVMADNCTDNTAQVARDNGAIVYERFNNEKIGKGYALDYLIHKIWEDKIICETYIIFDADNVVNKNFINEMNKIYDMGYEVATSYRNSKNYDDSWVSAGYGLWFLRESRYLNGARMTLGKCCAISGTGYMVSDGLLKAYNGWPFNTLTEDLEFTSKVVQDGKKIGYASEAVLYDEQPITFRQSFVQRARWVRGFYQVFGKHGRGLIKNTFAKRSFSCFDIFATIAPALIVGYITMIMYLGFDIYGLIAWDTKFLVASLIDGLLVMLYFYALLMVVGVITLITEWKKIRAKGWKKVVYLFFFPIFIISYLPIAIYAMFKNPQWKPIRHTRKVKITDIEQKESEPSEEREDKLETQEQTE